MENEPKDMSPEKAVKHFKEKEAKPVMVMLRFQSFEDDQNFTGTFPMPKGVFDHLMTYCMEWGSQVNMTHDQFLHYESLLDEDKMEKARNKLK